MKFREYRAESDLSAVRRIWREIGWLDSGKEEQFDRLIAVSRSHVVELNGEAECLVLTVPGRLRYLREELPISCVSGVTTSRIARKQGLAGRLTAHAVAADAGAGALVAALYCFEQGYYNRLGFGNSCYQIERTFDPSHLILNRESELRPRVPLRLTAADWEEAYQARLARRRCHGAIDVLSVETMRHEMEEASNGFGLGYRDGPNAALTHYLWVSTNNIGHGPYRVRWLVYQTRAQLLELLLQIKSLGDQVHSVKMIEPPGIQLQDLLLQPLRQRRITAHTEHPQFAETLACHQARILDLPGCLKSTVLAAGEIRFQLSLTDPIAEFLQPGSPWRGVAGDYCVTLGRVSSAERGRDASLPALMASVGAFTRLWLGVQPATGLAVTDALDGPPELLEALDEVLRLPQPQPDWEF